MAPHASMEATILVVLLAFERVSGSNVTDKSHKRSNPKVIQRLSEFGVFGVFFWGEGREGEVFQELFGCLGSYLLLCMD